MGKMIDNSRTIYWGNTAERNYSGSLGKEFIDKDGDIWTVFCAGTATVRSDPHLQAFGRHYVDDDEVIEPILEDYVVDECVAFMKTPEEIQEWLNDNPGKNLEGLTWYVEDNEYLDFVDVDVDSWEEAEEMWDDETAKFFHSLKTEDGLTIPAWIQIEVEKEAKQIAW